MEIENVSTEITNSSNNSQKDPMNISSITEQSQPFRTVQLQIPTTDGVNKKKEPIQRRGRRKSADLGNFQFHWKLEKNTIKDKKEKKNNNTQQFTDTIGINNGMNSPSSIRTKFNTNDKRRRPTSMPNLGPNIETYKAAQYLANFQLSQLNEKDKLAVLTQAAKLTNNERILPTLNALINEEKEEPTPKKRKFKKKTVKLPRQQEQQEQQENESGSSEEDKLQMMNLSEDSPIMNPSNSVNRSTEEIQTCKTIEGSPTLSKMSIANLVQ